MRQLSFLFLLFLLQSSLFVKAQVKIWTLDECIAHAIKENINVKQSSLDVATASIDKKGAIGNFLPTLNANASHSWNIGLNQDLTTGLLTNQTTQFTSAGANVGIDIYKGLQNQNNLRKANLSILAAKYQLLKMQEDIALNVANAYLQVLFAKENLKVQEEQLNISKKQQNRTQELVKAGSIPRGDLLDVNATVATNMQNVVVAQNNLLVSKLSVTQLLQLTEVDNFDVSPIATELVSQEVLNQNPETILKKAKETRTELKIANTNLEIAQKDLAIVKGALQPSFSAFYNFNTRVSYADIPKFNTQTNTIVGTQNANPFFQQFDRNKGQSFGAQLSIPVFNGFASQNNVERSKVSVEKSKFALEQQQFDLQKNVYTAFTDAKGALAAYDAAVIALEARQEAFTYAQEKNYVGLMNAFELNQAQTLLTNAQSEVVRTKYDYIFKLKIVEYYFGIPLLKNN